MSRQRNVGTDIPKIDVSGRYEVGNISGFIILSIILLRERRQGRGRHVERRAQRANEL
jgi:hypothetical protein